MKATFRTRKRLLAEHLRRRGLSLSDLERAARRNCLVYRFRARGDGTAELETSGSVEQVTEFIKESGLGPDGFRADDGATELEATGSVGQTADFIKGVGLRSAKEADE